jgi:hypothetical protein
MVGITRGLQLAGHEAFAVPAQPGWLSAELVRRHDPAFVLFGLHRSLQPEVAAWRAALPASTALVAWALDDPYDMRTTLETLPSWSAVLTPEQCAIDSYQRRGVRCGLLEPTVDDLTYQAPEVGTVVPTLRDVLSFAHVRLGPTRARWLPAIAQKLRAAGRTVDDSAGQRRWLVGRELVQALQSSRVTLDLPRDEFTRDNPDGVPCTYPGPRVHLAAACGVPCLCIAPRGGLFGAYPTALTCELEDAATVLLDLTNRSADARRALQGAATSTHAGFTARHRPEVRARELVQVLCELDPWRWRSRGL